MSRSIAIVAAVLFTIFALRAPEQAHAFGCGHGRPHGIRHGKGAGLRPFGGGAAYTPLGERDLCHSYNVPPFLFVGLSDVAANTGVQTDIGVGASCLDVENGSLSFDGSWVQISGPGTCTFFDEGSPDQISCDTNGEYVIEGMCHDGEYAVRDRFTVTVTPGI